MSAQRLELLVDKNAKLSAQCDVQRREINKLEKRLEQSAEREEAYQETLLCVNRLWEELNGAIGFVQYRASGTLGEARQENTEATDAELLRRANPFLARLLLTHLAGDREAEQVAEDFAEDVGEVEGRLRQRMAATLEGAAAALAAVEARCSSEGGGGGGDGGGSAAAAASKDAQLAALNNLLKAENNRLRDQALQDATKIKQLQCSLADREDELLVAQRKVTQLKAGGSVAGGAAGGGGEAAGGLSSPSGPAVAAGGGSNDGSELARVQQLLLKRTAELDEREEALIKADREVRGLRDTLASERERMARMQQYDQERFHHLNVELLKVEERARELQRARDALLVQLHDLRFQLDQAAHLRRQLPAADDRVRELERALAAQRAARAEAEAAAARERAAAGGRATAAELQEMIKALQNEVAGLKAAAERHKGLPAALEAAKATAEEQRRAAEVAAAEAGVLRRRCEEQGSALAAQRDKENRWQEREADLRLFVEVTTRSALPPSGTTARELADARVALARLQHQVSQLQAQLSSSGGGTEAAAARVAATQRQLDVAVEEAARLRAEAAGAARQLADLQQQVEDLKREGDAFMAEIESVGQAYEDAQAQNSRLLASLAQRDEDASKMLQQATAAQHERQRLAEERGEADAAAKRAAAAAAAAQQRVAELEGRVQALLHELDAAQGEARTAAARADAAEAELKAREQLLAAARADAEAAQAQAAHTASERDAEAEAARQHAARVRRLEEQLGEAAAAAERTRAAAAAPAGGGDQELQAEAAALRAMIRCNVCHQRQKDVVITKCWHMFCQECIRRNLDSRHRKCPGCGVSFGQGDVKHFYFT